MRNKPAIGHSFLQKTVRSRPYSIPHKSGRFYAAGIATGKTSESAGDSYFTYYKTIRGNLMLLKNTNQNVSIKRAIL